LKKQTLLNILRGTIREGDLREICEELALSEKVLKKALSIFNNFNKTNRTRQVRVASALYLASKIYGESRTAREISILFGVTEASIYSCAKEIWKSGII